MSQSGVTPGRSARSARWRKWSLMVTTLPIVGALVVLRELLRSVFAFEGIIEFTEVAVVLSGGVFLLGFMLAGTMGDYKEAEKMPGEIVTGLETIEEVMVHVATVKQDDTTKHRRSVLMVLDAIDRWLHKKATETELHEALNRLTSTFTAIELGSHATRAFSIMTNVRRALLRVSVTSRTGFLATGYALLEVMIGICYVILITSTFKSALGEIVVVSFVGLIYTYMYRLIKDIDDPFDFDEHGATGAAEVELYPLHEYRARLQARIVAADASVGRGPVDAARELARP
jgi:hypothetical protein